MKILSDIEIAQARKPLLITEIAKKYKFLMNILSNTVNIKQKLIIIILRT